MKGIEKEKNDTKNRSTLASNECVHITCYYTKTDKDY